MSDTITRDFEAILSQPTLAYEEGVRFFRGEGLMNDTLRQLARDLGSRQIPYCLVGAIALNQHGYQRFTVDIDLLLTPEGLQRFSDELVGPGYRPAFAGATKQFRTTAENVPIDIITSGEFPGSGKPQPISFPDPTTCAEEIGGVHTIVLEKLIELKLASGMTGAGRRKDIADVQELIRVRSLGPELALRLDPYVRDLYLELHDELHQS